MSHLPFSPNWRGLSSPLIFLFFTGFFISPFLASSQKVGINNTSPSGGLDVLHDDGLKVSGDFGEGAVHADSTGTMLLFSPKKGSFRVGRITDADSGVYEGWWGFPHTGDYSFATGLNSRSSGYISFTSGHKNQSTGLASFVAGGVSNIASGDYSFATGFENTSPSFGEFVVGTNALEYTPLGIEGFSAGDRVFVVGNGANSGSRSNALTILKNGNTGIGTASPAERLHVFGSQVIDDGTISFINTNGSIYIGGSAGQNAAGDLENVGIGLSSLINVGASASNTAVGSKTLTGMLTGIENAAFGAEALRYNTSGHSNLAAGTFALRDNTTGFFNTAVGQGALLFNTTGEQNVAVGSGALFAGTTGSQNVALGRDAGGGNLSSFNTFLGYQSGRFSVGSNNVFLGYKSGMNETGNNKLYIENSDSVTPLIYGDFSTNKVTINDSLASKYLQVTQGATSGHVLVSDANGVATWMDPQSLSSSYWSSASGNIYRNSSVGINTNNPLSPLHIVGDVRIETGRLLFELTNESILVGTNAGLNNAGSNNLFMGYESGYTNTTGSNNVGLGQSSLYYNLSGEDNIAIGRNALFDNTTGSGNIALGDFALTANTTKSSNIGIGANSLGTNITGESNIGIGFMTGFNVQGNQNTMIGHEAGHETSGAGNVMLGYQAGYAETGSNKLYIDNSNTATPLIYGDFSSNHLTVNDSLTSKILRVNGGRVSFENSGKSVFIGNNAGKNDDLTANQNVFIGEEAGLLSTIGQFNIAIGAGAFANSSAGSNNIAIGKSALASITTGITNIAIGSNTLDNNTTGTANTAIGYEALGTSSTGTANTAIGYKALIFNTGSQNTAIGTEAGFNNTGSGNVFVGRYAGREAVGSDQLYIDNTNTATPLIYGNFSTNKITINDSLSTKFFQLTNGATNNYLLKSDNTGRGMWTEPSLLFHNITSNNLFLGDEVGDMVTSAVDNTIVGPYAGTALTTGYENTGFGFWSLQLLTTGTSNTAIGHNTLSDLTTGQSNTALGWSALAGITGSHNTALGGGAGGENQTNGSRNTYIGYESGMNNQGSDNVFIGHNAGREESGSNKLYVDNTNTTTPLIYGDFSTNKITINDSLATKYFQMTNGAGSNYVLKSDNTGRGSWTEASLLFHNTSTFNLFIGDEVGDMITSATNNTIVGPSAAENLTSGSDNAAFGTLALQSITGGNFNTAIGNFSQMTLTMASNNTSLGYAALQTATGSHNTALGGSAGAGNSAGSRNTYVGYNAGFNNAGSDNVFIGHKAGEDEAGSNKLYIDNTDTATPLIHGDFSTDDVKVNGAFEVNGSVAAKFKTPLVAGTDNPDDTGMVWRYNSGTGTISLPGASTCPNRMYVIINQTGTPRTISQYRDLTTTPSTNINSSVALWLMSDGTEWWQIK